MTRAFQDHQIRQYLLGDLPANDESALETAYFRDSDLLARVELARDDLADDYAAARLSAADRQKFERRLLATAEGREQVAVTRALQHAAASGSKARQAPVWSIDRRWLSLAAVVPLAIGAFFIWQMMSDPDRSPVRTDANAPPAIESPSSTPATTARDSQPPAGEPSPSAATPDAPVMTLATLILTADLERSGGLPPTLAASSGATHVDLVAPPTGLTSGVVRVRVESVEGKSIWSGSMTVPDASATDPRPRARVPLSALRPGDYFFSILATGPADASGPLRYYFRVRAQ